MSGEERERERESYSTWLENSKRSSVPVFQTQTNLLHFRAGDQQIVNSLDYRMD